MNKEERRKKKLRIVNGKQMKRPNRAVLAIVSVFTAILLALNIFVGSFAMPYAGFLNNILTAKNVSDDAKEKSRLGAEMTQRIEEEGIILLKNQKNALPMNGNEKINIFGAGSINFTYGGTGSGSGDTTNNVTFAEGLEHAGFTVNPDLQEFYAQNTTKITGPTTGFLGSDFGVYEPAAELFTDDVVKNATEFSDTAVVLISRVGGEGFDLPMDMADQTGGNAGKSYLELQQNELDMLEIVKANFSNIYVVLNSPNAMELGFLEDNAIDAAIWAGCPGSTGCNAIGRVLAGAVNPSGRTVDTFAYEVESAPSYYNLGDYDYTNVTYTNTATFAGTTEEGSVGDDNYHYVEYKEGIYVGYRYYETAAEDGFIDYDKTVQYPFGYGLSYTSFDEKIDDFQMDGEKVKMDVRVTNTGDVPGKDVVEIYYSAPYTPDGIEKSSVVLAGYAKTKELAAGESETVSITFACEDMASYDYRGIKASGGGYVLEAGEYRVSLRRNSHDLIDEKSFQIEKDRIYDEAHDGKRDSDLITASNQFEDVSEGAGITYISRSDWSGTMPTERAAESKEMTEEQQKAMNTVTYPEDNEAEEITFAKHGLTINDLQGAAYDDEKWEQLLEQMSVKDMELLTGNGGWCTVRIPSIRKPHLVDCDGPNGINNLLAGTQGNQYTGQSVIGYTWNTSLAEEMGQCLGEEAKAYHISGIYAPGLNMHRSPFSGRNYEYVSEDPYLTGSIVAAETKGINAQGVYTYAKHYAVNDQETNRDQGGLFTWLDEQALREIYLRPFELCVKEGGTTGIMTSFNRIGTTPAAESYPLLTTVLREEWGFQGMAITDCVMSVDTEDVNKALRAGNDLQLNLMAQMRMNAETSDTPAGRQALRRASHNILYTITSSTALERADYALYGWVKAIIAVDVVLWALIVLYDTRWVMKYLKWRKGEPAVS